MSMIPSGISDSLPMMTDDVLGEIAVSKKYLPRIQLYGSNSKEVKKELIPMGRYGLTKGQILTDLGKEVKALVVAGQPWAMRIGQEGIEVNNDHTSAWFKETAELSLVNDTGYMVGPIFLLWLDQHKTFATFFASNASAKRVSPTIKAAMGKGMWMKVELVEKPKYSWHAPVIAPCTEPFTLPDEKAFSEAIALFKNVEVAKAAENAAEGGRDR